MLLQYFIDHCKYVLYLTLVSNVGVACCYYPLSFHHSVSNLRKIRDVTNEH